MNIKGKKLINTIIALQTSTGKEKTRERINMSVTELEFSFSTVESIFYYISIYFPAGRHFPRLFFFFGCLI